VIRKFHILLYSGLAVPLAACANYASPAPAAPPSLSRELPASFDRAWSAITGVTGGGFFEIATSDKVGGQMALAFATRDPAPYVDCGSTAGWRGRTRPALAGLGFNSAALQATADISLRPEGTDTTRIEVSDRYALGVYRLDPIGNRIKITEWDFGSGAAATQRVGFDHVTCRPSYEFERRLLDQVAARL
jgi:hypothetical protein